MYEDKRRSTRWGIVDKKKNALDERAEYEGKFDGRTLVDLS